MRFLIARNYSDASHKNFKQLTFEVEGNNLNITFGEFANNASVFRKTWVLH